MSRGELSETERPKETRFENAIPYFEKAVKAGPKYVTWVLGGRMHLAGLYMDELSKEIGAELRKESPLSTDALTGQAPPVQ